MGRFPHHLVKKEPEIDIMDMFEVFCLLKHNKMPWTDVGVF